MKKVSEHFTIDEVKCKCGCGFCEINNELLRKLEILRRKMERPIIIESWCRCPMHNKEVGGAERSSHLEGEAVDIRCSGSRTRFLIIKYALESGFTRIGTYKNRKIIHLDVSKDKMQEIMWVLE